MFYATGFRAADLQATLTGNCGSTPGIAYRLAWDVPHSPRSPPRWSRSTRTPGQPGLGRIAFVLVLALLVRFTFHRLINKVTERAATTRTSR